MKPNEKNKQATPLKCITTIEANTVFQQKYH